MEKEFIPLSVWRIWKESSHSYGRNRSQNLAHTTGLCIMHRTQIFVFLVLLGMKFPEAKASCNFIEAQMICVCSLRQKIEAQTLLTCLPATTYEVQDGNLEQFAAFSHYEPDKQIIGILENLPVRKLIFTNILLPEVLLPVALDFVSNTPLVSELEFVNCTFLRTVSWSYFRRLTPKLSSLNFRRITAHPLDDGVDIFSFAELLETLQNLTIAESRLESIPCEIGKMLTTLHFLDVSRNAFQDQTITSSFCKGAFPQLEVLNLHSNNLTSYEIVCKTLSHHNKLIHLDISQNVFLPRNFSSFCKWPQTLHIFNLSNTGLQYLDGSLPANIEILDLSHNQIFSFELSLHGLKELYLTSNKLQTIPSVSQLPSLEVLSLDQNQISRLPSKGLLQLKHLQRFNAGHNEYNCSCSNFMREIKDLAAKRSLLLNWPQDYVCKHPPDYRGLLIQDAPLTSLQCNRAVVYRSSVVTLIVNLHLIFYLIPGLPFQIFPTMGSKMLPV